MDSDIVVLEADTAVFEPKIPKLFRDVIVAPVYDEAFTVPFTSNVYCGFDVAIPTLGVDDVMLIIDNAVLSTLSPAAIRLTSTLGKSLPPPSSV